MNKIIFFYKFGNGGAERVILNLLDYTDNKPLIYTFKNLSDYRHENIRTVGFIEFLKLLKKCDILQVHLLKGLIFVSILKFIGYKFQAEAVHCFSYHGYLQNTYFKFFKKNIIKTALKTIDFHICKSFELEKEILKLFELQSQSKVVQNPLFNSAVSSYKRENLFNTQIRFCVVGRLEKSKNLTEFVKFVEIMPNEIEFRILGSGSMNKEIVNLLADKNITNVKLEGFCDNPAEIMHQCTHYISFSKNEGFPNALVEALSCGLISIHNDCRTGPREILGCDLNNKINTFLVAKRGILFNQTAENALAAFSHTVTKQISYEYFSSSIENFLSKLDPKVAANEYFET